MRSIKQIQKIIDTLIDELSEPESVSVIRNCTLYIDDNIGFAIAVKGKAKFLINTYKHNGFRGFGGCIINKYNIFVYDLMNLMNKMRLLTVDEINACHEYMRETDQKHNKEAKLKEAANMLKANGYQVSK